MIHSLASHPLTPWALAFVCAILIGGIVLHSGAAHRRHTIDRLTSFLPHDDDDDPRTAGGGRR